MTLGKGYAWLSECSFMYLDRVPGLHVIDQPSDEHDFGCFGGTPRVDVLPGREHRSSAAVGVLVGSERQACVGASEGRYLLVPLLVHPSLSTLRVDVKAFPSVRAITQELASATQFRSSTSWKHADRAEWHD
jgi:hypothetical protein